MSNRVVSRTVIPLCLFLVFMGMAVPNLARFDSPKPRQRAVIETTAKAGLEVIAKAGITVVAGNDILCLDVPVAVGYSFQAENHKFNFVPISHIAARAPPESSV